MGRSIVFVFSLSTFILSSMNLSAQPESPDSLYNVLRSTKLDTVKARTHLRLAEFYFGRNVDSADVNIGKAVSIIEKYVPSDNEKEKHQLGLLKAEGYNMLGIVHKERGEFGKSLDAYNISLKLAESLKEKGMVANTLNNMGIIYDLQGDAGKALDCYLRCLKMLEQATDKDSKYGMGYIMYNIAFIYGNQKDKKKALEYAKRSLAIREEIADQRGIATTCTYIGSLLQAIGQVDEALAYYERALEIFQAAGYKSGIVLGLSGMGKIYYVKKDFKTSKEYLIEALEVAKSIKGKNDISNQYLALADVEKEMGNLDKALAYGLESIAIAKETHRPESIGASAQVLQQIYVQRGDFKQAYTNYILYVEMRDSVNSEKNQKAAVQKEMQYLYEKKTAADSVRNAEQVKLEELKHEQEIGKQRSYTYGGIIGFVLMLLLAGISFRAFRIKRKANQEIADQKKIVEEKQKEIIDSITYAKRIQQSHMPTEKYFSQTLRRLNK